MKKCPFCAEWIQDEAIYCRYCQKDISSELDKTQVMPPKPMNNKPITYRYKLNAVQINKNGKLEIDDIIILGGIAVESYSFSDSLIKQINQMRVDFTVHRLLPLVRNLAVNTKGLSSIADCLYNINKSYLPWERILMCLYKERMDENISVNKTRAIAIGVTREFAIELLSKLSVIKVRHGILKFIKLTDLEKTNLQTLITLLLDHEVDIGKLSAKEIQYTNKLISIEDQTPFLLELNRIMNVFDLQLSIDK